MTISVLLFHNYLMRIPLKGLSCLMKVMKYSLSEFLLGSTVLTRDSFSL